jgi:hypothetical protein
LADKSIDERGFARVGAANNCDEARFECHGYRNCTPLRWDEESSVGLPMSRSGLLSGSRATTGECFTQNLRLVLAPSSCTLIFSSRTRSRPTRANDRRPLPKKHRDDINTKFVENSRIEDLLDYASPYAACVQHNGP